ncbi:MAG: hypothetical protein V3S78_06025, partial [Hyphomicrobium sp.]
VPYCSSFTHAVCLWHKPRHHSAIAYARHVWFSRYSPIAQCAGAWDLVGHEAFAAALLANSIGELGGHRAPSSHQFPLRQFGLASEPSHSDLVLKGALFSPFGALFSPFNEEER